jgi:general secretion pathway protein G
MRARERENRAVVRGGFTLMEMMVVVMILVVLAGTAVPLYLKYLDDARINRAKTDVRTLTTAASAYKAKYGEYPASLRAMTTVEPDGTAPTLEESALVDPWFREYQYAAQGPHNQMYGKPDIWSQGPNPGNPNGQIGNWGVATAAGGGG